MVHYRTHKLPIVNQMKLLLITLSILLTSSPLFGQETGVLFFSFENGEFVYSEEGEDDNDGKYVGEFKDGKPNGQGTLTLFDGTKSVGEFKDEEFHGQGTLTRPDGGKYVGEFKDGETKRSWYCHLKGWEVCRRMEW